MKKNLIYIGKFTSCLGIMILLFACTPSPRDAVKAFSKTIYDRDLVRCQKYMTEEYAISFNNYSNLFSSFKYDIIINNAEVKSVMSDNNLTIAELFVDVKYKWLQSNYSSYLELEMTNSNKKWLISDITIKIPRFTEFIDVSNELPEKFMYVKERPVKEKIYNVNDKLTNFLQRFNTYHETWLL